MNGKSHSNRKSVLVQALVASVLLACSGASLPAVAGTIEDCYSAAETANSGLSVTVKLGTVTQLTSSDLDAIFDKIAEKHTAGNLNLTYNAAGESAMEQAMDCIFDAELGTLSSIVTNQRFSALRVRTNTSTILDGGTPDGHMRFDTYDSSNCQGDPALVFEENGGPRMISFAGLSLGSNDIKINFTPAHSCIPTSTCEQCLGECDEQGNSVCVCSGAGSCDEPFPGIAFDSSNVFTVQF